MGKKLEFNVDGKPAAQGRARVAVQMTKDNRIFAKLYDPKKSKEYKEIVAWTARIAAGGVGWEPVKCAVAVEADFYLGPARNGERYMTVKPDLSNCIKGIEDALNGIVYDDDAQIVELNTRKHYGNPMVKITIRTLDDDDKQTSKEG